jgi:uncharacterized protein
MTVSTLSESLLAKEADLKRRIAAYGSLAVAYSGGVDSAYLATIAHEVLGHGVAMVLADSPSIPRSEVAAAEHLALERGWNFTKIATQEFENDAFLKNDGTRCYFCKSELFTRMDAFTREHDIRIMAYGEIAEDRLDTTRVGARAAKEHEVVAPLADAGLHKDEIRALSRHRGLPTWDKPSFACLSSRFPWAPASTWPRCRKSRPLRNCSRAWAFANTARATMATSAESKSPPKIFPACSIPLCAAHWRARSAP